MDAEEIVRKLAAADAPMDVEFDECRLCGVVSSDTGDWQDVGFHEPGCPWRLAREWVAANPAGG